MIEHCTFMRFRMRSQVSTPQYASWSRDNDKLSANKRRALTFSAKVIFSKLHLVDLAGSERLKKSWPQRFQSYKWDLQQPSQSGWENMGNSWVLILTPWRWINVESNDSSTVRRFKCMGKNSCVWINCCPHHVELKFCWTMLHYIILFSMSNGVMWNSWGRSAFWKPPWKPPRTGSDGVMLKEVGKRAKPECFSKGWAHFSSQDHICWMFQQILMISQMFFFLPVIVCKHI